MNKQYSIKVNSEKNRNELTVYMSYADMPFNLWREISKLCSEGRHYSKDELEPGSSIRTVYIFDGMGAPSRLDSAKNLLSKEEFIEV